MSLTNHKRRVVLLCFTAALIFAAGVLARPLVSTLIFRLRAAPLARATEAPPLDGPHYARMSEFYAGLAENRKIVFLGDSRIEFADWGELFQHCDFSNRGISGDTTEGLLRRVRSSVPTNEAICIVQVGVNDLQLGAGVELLLTNYRAILDYLVREKSDRVIVTSIILATATRGDLNAAIGEANRQLSQLAHDVGAEWVDLNATLAREGSLAPEYSSDEVHLNHRGYTRVRDALLPYLNQSLAGEGAPIGTGPGR